MVVAEKTRRHSEMSSWQRWVQQPQNLWIRKALFQIHLWMGIGIGLYIVLISLSGAAVVYRKELTIKYARKPVFVNTAGPKLDPEVLKENVQRLYPGYRVEYI